MTSRRQKRANRKNAKASTGPKTIKGKMRVAQNAIRHGLNLPVQSDSSLGPGVKALARQIAGVSADPALNELALRIADAHFDVQRVRARKHRLIADAYDDPLYESYKAFFHRQRAATALAKANTAREITPGMYAPFMPRPLDGPEKLAAIFDDKAHELERLDRYERRALSRRKFAIRDFDAAKRSGSTSAPNSVSP